MSKDCKERGRKSFSIIRERSDLTFKGGLGLRDCGIERILCGICAGFRDEQKNQQDLRTKSESGFG